MFGRSIIVPLTNKSGGGVVLGDVVVVDTTTDESFTTTTSAANTSAIGVAAETIANNATGRIIVGGYASLVNVNASVTRNQFGTTHTVAKQATSSATRVAGTFCRWLKTSATPSAYIYPVDLAGAALTNPMTTVGDIIQGGAAGAPARLAAGTSGYVLQAAGAAASVAWAQAMPLQVATVATSQSTASASYTDLATTGPAVTITVPASGNVLVGISAEVSNSASGLSITSIAVSGASTVAAPAQNFYIYWVGNSNGGSGSRVGVLTGLSAGSTTLTMKYKSTAGTGFFGTREIWAIPLP